MSKKTYISLSASPATVLVKKPYYDLPSTVTMMNRLYAESAVDGFEIQYLAEWNKKNPPLDDVAGHRYAAWKKSPKYTVDEVAVFLEGVPVLSVHANRDVGIFLCSGNEENIKKGKTLIHESLSLTEKVGARVCVFHLWDTWKPDVDIMFLKTVLYEIAPSYSVKAAVENIPTHVEGTPFDLVKECKWVTLDIRWAAMYDELEKFESIKEKIVNIHLRGTLQQNIWVLDNAPFTFYEALDTIKSWYTGLLTMEPEGGLKDGTWENVITAMKSIRKYSQQEGKG